MRISELKIVYCKSANSVTGDEYLNWSASCKVWSPDYGEFEYFSGHHFADDLIDIKNKLAMYLTNVCLPSYSSREYEFRREMDRIVAVADVHELSVDNFYKRKSTNGLFQNIDEYYSIDLI